VRLCRSARLCDEFGRSRIDFCLRGDFIRGPVWMAGLGVSRWSAWKALARLMDAHPGQLTLAIDTDSGRKIFMAFDGPQIDHSEPFVCVRIRVEDRRATRRAKVALGALRHRIIDKRLAPGNDSEVFFSYNEVGREWSPGHASTQPAVASDDLQCRADHVVPDLAALTAPG